MISFLSEQSASTNKALNRVKSRRSPADRSRKKPEAGLKNLFEALRGLIPAAAHNLVVDYVDRTLRTKVLASPLLGYKRVQGGSERASVGKEAAKEESDVLNERREIPPAPSIMSRFAWLSCGRYYWG